MARHKRGKNLKNWNSNQAQPAPGKLRIIGGTFRGRMIEYSGDRVTRPMKDNIREALFNLVGGWAKGKAVFDLFAGTGAIGLEAISRGAIQAALVERHFPTVKIIEQNVATLEVESKCDVHASDTFFWVRKFVATPASHPSAPWMVFCCPPYDFFVDRTEDTMTMLDSIMSLAPSDSIVIVESDSRFDLTALPRHEEWEIREYAPAVISVLKL